VRAVSILGSGAETITATRAYAILNADELGYARLVSRQIARARPTED